MSNLHTPFIIYLRHPIGYPELDESKWFQWRSVDMIELSALDTYRFVKSILPHRAQKILEIGCGNGYLSLEVARDGHDVIGIDLSPDIIEVDERTKDAYPDTPVFGRLRYLCADFGTWQVPDASFDRVIFNRSLHHMSELQQTVAKVKQLLRSGGSVICQDYAYDRFDEQTACWLYQIHRLLSLITPYYTAPPITPTHAQPIHE